MKIIPNILSALRIIIAPILLYLAWFGHKKYFIIFLIISLLSDAIDGFIARKLELTTKAGAKLDSVGDMTTYLVVPLCAWWLWPEILKKEAPYVLIAVSAYIFPLIAGILKFHKIPSYHTYGAKTAAVVMSAGIFFLFLTDFTVVFRIAAIFQAIVAIEEIAITIQISEPKSNVKSIWHVKEGSGET